MINAESQPDVPDSDWAYAQPGRAWLAFYEDG